MPLTSLKFKPGINRETTSYTNEGGWFNGDKIRFRFGYPEKIGGWSTYSDNTFLGTCRALFSWVALEGTKFLGVGTNLKYYIADGGQYNDITPIRRTSGTLSNIFAVTDGSKVIAVTDAGHGAVLNDFVTFSGATGLGGEVTADILNAEHKITKIVNNEVYEITLSGNAADSTDAANHTPGGSSIVATYQINTGLDTNFFGTGWGAGVWNGVDTDELTTTLAEELDASETDVDVTSASGMATTDVISVAGELMIITNISSNTLTVTRGHGGTTAAVHANGELVRLVKGNATASDDTVTLINGSSLASDVTATSVTVDSAAAFTATGSANFIKIDDEIMQYTGTTSTSFTGLVRGAFNTTAATHADNAAVIEASFGWGMTFTTTVAGANLTNWTHDNFGEDLLINVNNGGIYYWDRTSGTSSRAVELNTLSGSTLAPTIAKQIMTSDPDRHVIAFGCDPEANIGTQDPLLIRFGSQESLTDWQSLATNTAGELRLSTGSEIVVALQTKQQILVYTDVSLYSMQFLGPPFTFGLTEISRNITIASPNSAVAVNDFVYWMGSKEFYVYSGTVQRLPCTVLDYVFSDFNRDQIGKITAGHNSSYGEVWWFYPSESSSTNDRYVIYNYQEKVWYFGNLPRTAWVDRGINQYPIAASTDNKLYYHEFGQDDGSTNPSSAISSNIESSQMDLGEGDKFLLASKLIPDITFRDSENSAPSASFTVQVRQNPGINYDATSASTVTRSATTPVEAFTDEAFIRLRGRSFAIKVSSDDTGVMWRLGTPRIQLRPDGRR
tara:strand:- start:3363 stop:5723 length:2361 start_codon:yes stop_codon:yes gene_type:complete